MKKAEILTPGEPLCIVTTVLPKTPKNGVLIKTQYAGICHSDIHFAEDEIDVGSGAVYRLRDLYGNSSIICLLNMRKCILYTSI